MEKLIVVIEGPSGVGKDSIIQGLINKYGIYKKMPSVTTREMRPTESQGNPYFFVSVEQFKKKIKNGDVFEHTMRHGTYRGMSHALIKEIFDAGLIPLKDADIVGIKALKRSYQGKVLTIFVKTTREQVKARLLNRGDGAQDIDVRLKDFDFMMQFESEFDFSVENIYLNETIDKVHEIIQNYLKELS